VILKNYHQHTCTECSKSHFAKKQDTKTTYLLSTALKKLFKMCARVLAPSPTPTLTQKHVSTHLNKFQLGLQFVTKQNYSFLLGKANFGTHCIATYLYSGIFLCRYAIPEALNQKNTSHKLFFLPYVEQGLVCIVILPSSFKQTAPEIKTIHSSLAECWVSLCVPEPMSLYK
jgi:hypothetical protein